jgi:Fe-S-cluster containining protein
VVDSVHAALYKHTGVMERDDDQTLVTLQRVRQPMTAGRVPWYAHPDPTGKTETGETGLRFECTQCGNCCTGPPGYVLFTDAEGDAMAGDLGVTRREFDARYTHDTPEGRSLIEVRTSHGYDCVFLDRQRVPGRALCRVYRSRPRQCRTWPFWKENLRSPRHWASAGRTCPGMDTGRLYAPDMIELTVEGDGGAARR